MTIFQYTWNGRSSVYSNTYFYTEMFVSAYNVQKASMKFSLDNMGRDKGCYLLEPVNKKTTYGKTGNYMKFSNGNTGRDKGCYLLEPMNKKAEYGRTGNYMKFSS